MVETVKSTGAAGGDLSWEQPTAYDRWIESVGVPVHKGYFVPDARTVELGWWAERECNTAFLELVGQEGVTEVRITEIPPGKTLPPLKFAMDEIVYVLAGRGLTTISDSAGRERHSFEWQTHSMFLLPRNCTHQLSNAQGTRPALLLQSSYLPLAMSAIGEPSVFFNNPSSGDALLNAAELSSDARAVTQAFEAGGPAAGVFWYGNFFPNMRTWENLTAFTARGAGGQVVWIRFPNSPMTAHMSVFPAQTYKKGHRHGPGWVIVIPAGEGYSIMWPENGEKIIVPWSEGAVFVPPNRWFHQHFNLGSSAARYLALHPPSFLAGFSEKIEDMARDQIEYVNEDPFIRQRFESELEKRGLPSLMVPEAYTNRNYKWD